MKTTRVLVVLLILALAGGALALYAQRTVTAFRDTPFGTDQEKVVEVPPGSSARAVVRLLARAGVLSDERLAWWYVRWLRHDRRPMRAGEYAFTGPLRPDEALEKVYRGDVKLYHFTIPEGLRMDEVAPLIEKSGLAHATDLATLMRDRKLTAELSVPFSNLEGFLFPDTYSFSKGPKPRAILSAMVTRFQEEYRKANATRQPSVTLTEGQVATLASIVEKETGRPDERPHIACVFLNRLARGIRLQTDPTVMYATMLRNGGRWSKNITKADLLAPHPYNTYTTSGLPPGPIAGAGAAAIWAVLHPARCDDLFFVSRNDGSHVFCPNLACHNAAVQRWQIDFFRSHGSAATAQQTSTSAAPRAAPAQPATAKRAAPGAPHRQRAVRPR